MMEIMNHLLVNDHILWQDGSITVPSDIITKYIHLAETGKLFTDEITPEITEFNSVSTDKILVKKKVATLSTDWVLPIEITSIDIKEHLLDTLIEEFAFSSFTDEEMRIRIKRLDYEYDAFIDAGLTDLIYAILYVINRFEANNTVWGVGRGSSTSSYLLYILGIHDIDSVEYELDFTEFLH